MDNGRLSAKQHWDSLASEHSLPRIASPQKYGSLVTMRFIDGILRNEKKSTFFEIGCAASGWLPYFAQKYGYLVSGLDYSEVGCRLAEENLNRLNIRYDQIICTDVFKWRSEKKFDIIFTYGVLEHFEKPQALIDICYKHLNDNGVIITLVPNLQGVMGVLFRFFAYDIYKMHIVISKDALKQVHIDAGFRDIKTDYVGTFSLGVIPWRLSNRWLLKKDSLRAWITLKLIGLAHWCIGTILKMLNCEISSKFFSPYIVSIMRKNNRYEHNVMD